ncbi:uncharacterized protein RSE6_14462 [Rhynchosporium secalis]|uniref:FAD-binding domain-containing protein n=1 Tax=Rhynchosporium secalis TaxID=38038 RepID=A0A1E1MVC9_RHYSE|nr:uncharacterized protein RSE6_14462 [Rhynchosporium secalis]
MLSSPILSPLVLQPSSTIWFGPYRHIVAYTIRGTEFINIVFCGPGVAETGRWNEPADLDQLRKEYSDHEDTVKEILRVANEFHKFRISETPDLPSWTNSNGRLVLLGDAAHAMMPYMAQGATQAIEDAAVLNGCLARAQSLNDIFRLSKAYEDIRKPRAEKIKATSLGNMKQYGLPDGPEQEERDEMYRKSHLPVSESTKEILVSKPDNNAVYGSPAFSSWIYMYDTKEALREYFGDEKESSKR